MVRPERAGRAGPGGRRTARIWLFDLGPRGVALVGEIPSGLPQLSVPDPGLLWDHAGTAATAAVALVLIGFSQTAGDARTFAAKHQYQIDINQESVAQGSRTPARGCSRACRCRPACRQAL